MNFYIDKPTLRDIPAMRNLVLPEVQKGIILDRTEDEMAGVIRSYSVIRVVLNSSLGTPCGDLADFGRLAQTSSPALRPKFAKNHESQTENPSVVDSANLTNSQNLGENQVKIAESTTFCNATIFCHSERSEESQKNIQNRDSSVASLSQNDNLSRFAESTLDSAESQNLKKQPANSSIVDEKSGLRSHERGNRTNGSLTKRVASLPDLSPQDEFGSPSKNPIVAFAALQILSLTLAEVRSLIVAENYRRNGLATMLIEHLITEARALNLKEVLALTYQRKVFEKLGFKEIAKESLPNQKIWADCIKCKKFPVCDEIALTKIL